MALEVLLAIFLIIVVLFQPGSTEVTSRRSGHVLGSTGQTLEGRVEKG